MAHDNVLPLEGSNRPSSRDDRLIGAILVNSGRLRPADLEHIVELQKRSSLYFGEAARQLGLVEESDIQAALALQFDLPQWTADQRRPGPELVAAFAPRHPCTEELRGLRTQLLMRWFDPAAGRRVLAITSPERGDGRSYMAANLAVVFSQLGLRTLLIDGDLRHPRQHLIFNIANRAGLASILAGRADPGCFVAVPGCSRLSVLPAGAPPPNPQELLSRPALVTLLDEYRTKFELILIDTSAERGFADSKNVVFRAGSALVLVRKGHSRLSDIHHMLLEFNETGTRVAGLVINSG